MRDHVAEIDGLEKEAVEPAEHGGLLLLVVAADGEHSHPGGAVDSQGLKLTQQPPAAVFALHVEIDENRVERVRLGDTNAPARRVAANDLGAEAAEVRDKQVDGVLMVVHDEDGEAV